ncbi:hypothetical protein H8959_008612 [Pygathrix nigripes]
MSTAQRPAHVAELEWGPGMHSPAHVFHRQAADARGPPGQAHSASRGAVEGWFRFPSVRMGSCCRGHQRSDPLAAHAGTCWAHGLCVQLFEEPSAICRGRTSHAPTSDAEEWEVVPCQSPLPRADRGGSQGQLGRERDDRVPAQKGLCPLPTAQDGGTAARSDLLCDLNPATSPSGSKMQLLETEFSHTVGELIEVHLRRQDSIPAFLSSLTLELFSRQTVA